MLNKLLITFSIIFFIVCQSFSQDLARESFIYDFTIAGLGGAENGFSGPWATDDANAVESMTSLVSNVFDYDALNWAIPDTGNQIQVTRVNPWSDWARYKRPLAETWPNEAGKTYWLSYLVDIKDPLPIANTLFMVKLYKDNSELLAVGKAGGGPATPVYTCGSGWVGEGDDVSSVEIEGGPVWLVARVDMSGGTGVDRTFMWVDPDPSVEPDTSDADVKRNSNMTDGINAIAIEYGGDGASQYIFDEITLASSYSDLTKKMITALPKVVNSNIPRELTLAQNYPNPFNPTTTISYNLEKKIKVRLSVFDLLGREIAVLVNGTQDAGPHTIDFNADNLPSGVYFYKLESAQGTITKKMALLK